jgi:hypothetical protein
VIVAGPRQPTGHTYVIAYPSAGVVKIGQAVYYAERVEQVRNMSPVTTETLFVFVGLQHERELHNRFAHLRTRGEFFQDTDELRSYLLSRNDAIALMRGRYLRAATLAVAPENRGAIAKPKVGLNHCLRWKGMREADYHGP